MPLADWLRKIFVSHPQDRPAPSYPPGGGEAFTGNFIGPGIPPFPAYPQAEPRYFDYTSGVNAIIIPRTEYNNLIPNFAQLWLAYQVSPLIKVATTFQIQQVLAPQWRIDQRDGSGFVTTDPKDYRKLIETPDPQMDYDFEQWLHSILIEIIVTDALTIFPVRNKFGNVIAFRQIDGQTMKPLIDYDRGGYPVPPAPAFTQFIKGTPFAWYTSEQILYRPFRPRPWCIYGESRVERILSSVMLYALHENWTADFFTQGNIPEVAALTDPQHIEIQNPDKFRQWQILMDEVAGLTSKRRRVHLLPSFIKSIQPLKEFSFEKTLPDWLVRFVCIEFGVPSHLFTSETNRATAKEMNEVLYEAPLRQVFSSIKRLFDKLLAIAGAPELEFKWEKNLDFRKEAVEGISILVNPPGGGSQIMTVPEAREQLGLSAGDEEGEPGAEQPEYDQDPNQDPNAQQQPPTNGQQQPAQPQEPQKAAVYDIRTKSRKAPAVWPGQFHGHARQKRAALATKLARPIYKQLRRRQTEIVREALELARKRGKNVTGA